MIEFATLFLSLVTGIHPVEVVVTDPVVSVEIVLDGQTVGVIEGEPWRINCNFGPDPRRCAWSCWIRRTTRQPRCG